MVQWGQCCGASHTSGDTLSIFSYPDNAKSHTVSITKVWLCSWVQALNLAKTQNCWAARILCKKKWGIPEFLSPRGDSKHALVSLEFCEIYCCHQNIFVFFQNDFYFYEIVKYLCINNWGPILDMYIFLITRLCFFFYVDFGQCPKFFWKWSGWSSDWLISGCVHIFNCYYFNWLIN